MGREHGLAVLCVVLTTSMTLISGVSHGQSLKGGVRQSGGGGYFMVGSSVIDIKELNSRLEAKQYSKLSDKFVSFGGGGHAIMGRLIIGGEGHGLIGKGTATGDYKVSFNAGCGFFDLGYIVYSRRGLSLYPFLGIGGGGMSLKIVDRQTPTFDEALENPRRGTELASGSMLLNLSIGADYLFNLGGEQDAEGGLLLGIRAGYTFAPIKGEWKTDESTVSGGPEVGVEGPYLRLAIGGGGSAKR